MPFKDFVAFATSRTAKTAVKAVKVELENESVVKPLKKGLAMAGIEDVFAVTDVHVKLLFNESGDIITRVEEQFAAVETSPAPSSVATLVNSPMSAALPDLDDDSVEAANGPIAVSITPPPALANASELPTRAQASDVTAVSKPDVPGPTVATPARPLNTNDLRMITPLGEGANGTVTLVANRATNLLYALKAMEKPNDPAIQACIFQEQDVLKRLAKSPWFLALKGSFEDDKHFFLLTDFYEGGDMKNRLENAEGGRFTPEETRNYCAQIILAMEELHRNHIVHRDLKPANLLLNYQDEVIIADFGLARAFGQTAHDQPSNDTDDTFSPVSSCGTFGALSGKVDQTAQQCGTLSYMAPEVWLGQPYSYGVDVWAFGVIMYEMLHGKLPFDLDEIDESLWSIEDYVDRICGEELRVDDGIEDDAYDALHFILEKDPLKRPSWEQIKKHPWFDGVDWAQLSRRTQAEAPEAPEEDHELDTALFGTPYAVGEEPHPFFQWTSEEIEPRPLRASSEVAALASSVCTISLSSSTGHPASAPCLAVLAAGSSAQGQTATETLCTCSSGASNWSLQDLYEGDQDEDIDAMDINTRVTSTILLDGDTNSVAWMPHSCFPLEANLTELLDDVQLVEEDLDASKILSSGAIGSFAIVPPSLSPSSASYRTPSMSSSGSHAGTSSYSVSSSRSSAFVDTFYSPPTISTTDVDVFAHPVYPEDHPLPMGAFSSLAKVQKTTADNPPSLVAPLSAFHPTSSPCSSLSSLPDSTRATAISDAGEHSTSSSPRPTGRSWFGRLKVWWTRLWLTTARPVLF